MTMDVEPGRSRRRLAVVALGALLAVLAASVAAVAAMIRQKGDEESHITMSMTIDRPPDVVFEFVSDARNTLEWLPVAVERRKMTDGPIGLGTKFEATDRIGGRNVQHTQEIVQFQPDRRVTSRLSAPWNGDYEIRVEPADEGTLLTVDMTGRPSGVFAFFRFVPATVAQGQLERDYRQLKEILEQPEETRVGRAAVAVPIETEGEAALAEPEETPVS